MFHTACFVCHYSWINLLLMRDTVLPVPDCEVYYTFSILKTPTKQPSAIACTPHSHQNLWTDPWRAKHLSCYCLELILLNLLLWPDYLQVSKGNEFLGNISAWKLLRCMSAWEVLTLPSTLEDSGQHLQHVNSFRCPWQTAWLTISKSFSIHK